MDNGGSLVVIKASAGSGKTFALAADYCSAVVADPTAYRRILAVTFTNKATAEMKRRILGELHALSAQKIDTPFGREIRRQTNLPDSVVAARAREALHLILTDYGAFAVTTIDAFFQRIVRSFFRELGLDFSYAVELDSRGALSLAVDLLIEASAADPLLGQLIERVVGEQLDRGRRWNAAEALETLGGELLKEAYQAPDPTPEELIARYRELKQSYDAQNGALRAECAAAVELIRSAGLTANDFKYGKGSFVPYLMRTAQGRGEIEAYGARLAAAAEDPEAMVPKERDAVRAILSPLAAHLARFVALYDQTQTERRTFEALSERFSRYVLLERLKEQFDGVMAAEGRLAISRTTGFVDRIAREASVPFVFEKLGTRFERIFIDEFQDTSVGQWRGFRPLVDEVLATGGRVVLIGDVKQAIYRWRGGDWTILGGGLEREFDQIDDSKTLDTSYRSCRTVVEFNNALWERLVHAAQGTAAELLEGERGALYDRLISAAPSAYRGAAQQVVKEGGAVETWRYETDDESIEQTILRIEDAASRGTALGDVAVLVRTHAEGVRLADRLADRGIAVVSDELLLVARSAAVRFVVEVWKWAAYGDPVSLVAANRYLGRELTAAPSDDERAWLDALAFLPSVEALEATVERYKLQEQDPAYLQAFYEEVYAFSAEESTDVGDFLAHWTERSARLSLPSLSARRDAVQLLTIHKAKGLEFDVVCVPWASWTVRPKPGSTYWVSTSAEPYDAFNPVPVSYNDALKESVYRPDYLEEGVSTAVDNLNLVYVALTRAAHELYVGLPAKPKKGTVGAWIDEALHAMEWGGSAGKKERAEQTNAPQAPLLRSTPSYPSSAALAAPDEE